MDVIRRDDNSSFVISDSWRFLYACVYLWDSSSILLMSFLTLSGVFSKKDTIFCTRKFCTRQILWVRYSSSRALFKSPSQGRGRGRGGQRHRAKLSHAQHLEQRQTQELSCVSAVYKWTRLKSQNPKQQYKVREIREKTRNQVTRPMVQNSPKMRKRDYRL